METLFDVENDVTSSNSTPGKGTLDGNILAWSVGIDFAIQWVVFAISALLKTEKFYDLTGSGTFILLAVLSLVLNGEYYVRQCVQTGLVVVWGLRLGIFLFSRVISAPDRRFDDAKKDPKVYFIYWTMQAVWIFATLVPTLMLNAETKDKSLGVRDYIGWSIWLIGFLMETISDIQKTIFKKNPDNAGKFINTGLWSISRHPNYFGEIVLWIGLWLSASSVMTDWDYFSVLSPIFVWLLISKISGIPILERQGMTKWGEDPDYLIYIKKVPVLIPFIGMKK
ncbi:uncharacterized protein [Antedon mediterranea]|uniref:uncharacterized protein n=1 Tax=Antedon mediterranea TaxID=105859 RepID=UPI003AF78098